MKKNFPEIRRHKSKYDKVNIIHRIFSNVKTLCLSQFKRGRLTDDNGEYNAVSTTKLSVLEEIVNLMMAEKKKLVIIARFVVEINNIQEVWEKKGLGYAVVKIVILVIYVLQLLSKRDR